MGEKSVPPRENGFSHENNDNVDEEMEPENEETVEDIDDMSPEEFATLDNQLDALNSALDDIEQKNDNIHAQLLQLLVANREIRQQLQESNNGKEASNTAPKQD